MDEGPRICEEGGHGLIFPLGGDSEHLWDPRIRAFIYSVALVYCFLGVSIVADLFMGAIESITSKKQRVQVKATGRYITVAVWNDTVANLTLLALGSSAPEILLSGVEIVRNEFFAGKLGPSTIVGSAAFNLLVIIAVCNCSIPSPERRMIRDIGVFNVTAFFSLFAYIWLVFIVQVHSKDVIEIWEGIITFSFFPVLVAISYLADVGWFRTDDHKRPTRGRMASNKLGDAGVVKVEVVDKSQEGDAPAVAPATVVPAAPALSPSPLPGIPDSENTTRWSRQDFPDGGWSRQETPDTSHQDRASLSSRQRAIRRSDAIHMFTGAKRIHGDIITTPGAHPVTRSSKNGVPSSSRSSWVRSNRNSIESVVNELDDAPFNENGSCVVRTLSLDVAGCTKMMREQNQIGSNRFSDTSIETGIASSHLSNMLSFSSERPETIQEAPQNSLTAPEEPDILDGNGQIIQNSSGVLTFGDDVMEVLGSRETKEMPVPVFRRNGTDGTVSCRWFTDKLSAVPGYDYVDDEGELIFGPGVSRAEIPIVVLPKRPCERSDEFQVVIEGATGGAVFNPNADGGPEANIITIKIRNENNIAASSRTMHFVEGVVDMDAIRLGSSSWYAQIKEAIFVNGSYEEQSEAGVADWLMHIIVLPWKFFYSLTVPPPVYLNGWMCFLFSLLHIGCLTAVIIDITELFGCVANIEDSISAITFVALGTSLPDLFASKTAAIQDAFADASIVNVTGSNSVNVFLGIGLPWTMASIRWKNVGASEKWKLKYPRLLEEWPQGAFVVEARGLSFSVIVFTIAAFVWLVVMTIRRRALGGELGGPLGAKVFTSLLLILLWIFYVSLSIWKALTKSDSAGAQVSAVLFAVAMLAGIVLLLGMGINLCGSCCNLANCCGFALNPGLSDNNQPNPPVVETPPPPKPFESWGVQPPASFASPMGAGGAPEISDQQPMDSTRVLNVLRQLRRDQVHVCETVARWNNVLTSLQQAIGSDGGLPEAEDPKDVASPAAEDSRKRHEDDRDNIVSLPPGMGGMKLVVEEEVLSQTASDYGSVQKTNTRNDSDSSVRLPRARSPGPALPERISQPVSPPLEAIRVLPGCTSGMASAHREGLEVRDAREARVRASGVQEPHASCRVINM